MAIRLENSSEDKRVKAQAATRNFMNRRLDSVGGESHSPFVNYLNRKHANKNTTPIEVGLP